MKVPAPARRHGAWLPVAILVWLCGLCAGFGLIWAYQTTPGAVGVSPAHWPAQSALPRPAGRAALLMFLHPHCDCSRASLEQLRGILARSGNAVSARVLFVRPAGAASGWESSPLWQAASAIPGLATQLDADGLEAARFGAITSGHVVLYGADGRLLFAGGITGTRGHIGDNAGTERVLGLLLHGRSDLPSARVYGCALGTATPAPNSRASSS